jgi:hypothetical protein
MMDNVQNCDSYIKYIRFLNLRIGWVESTKKPCYYLIQYTSFV